MKKLVNTDFVVYDKLHDEVIQFVDTHEFAIYGSKEEAIEDTNYGEEAISCTDLPQHWQDILIKQINKNQNGKRH